MRWKDREVRIGGKQVELKPYGAKNKLRTRALSGLTCDKKNINLLLIKYLQYVGSIQ
jgi:hypothetical protein